MNSIQCGENFTVGEGEEVFQKILGCRTKLLDPQNKLRQTYFNLTIFWEFVGRNNHQTMGETMAKKKAAKKTKKKTTKKAAKKTTKKKAKRR